MKKVEYVHELEEKKEYLFLVDGYYTSYTFLSLYYRGEQKYGPDGVYVFGRRQPFLWEEIKIFYIEEGGEDELEEDPYFSYENYVSSLIEI